jgi:HSP20 family molecular chaperone IbpA
MESEFEPAVRTEETPEAHIVEIDLPGFRREDLRVQINNRGSLVISGERSAKEMEEMTKVGGRMEKIQRGVQRFRKVISVPLNLNYDVITAKFRDEILRVSLPFLHVSGQQNQDTVSGSGKSEQSLQSNVERSSPAGQEDSRKESPALPKDDQSARHPEAIRQDDDKEKPTVPAEKSNELVEEKKTEAPEQAEELAGEPPRSTHAQTVSDEKGSAHRSEYIQSKLKPDVETLLQEDGRQKSGKPPECRHPPQEKKKEACAYDGKPAEKDYHVAKEAIGDGVRRIVKKDDENCSTWLAGKFADQKRILFPDSCSSTFSKRGVLIASTVLVLSVGLYVTYKSRSRRRI